MVPFIKYENEKCRITEKDIGAVEEKFGISFPEDLKAYYLRFNGAETALCAYRKDGGNYEVDVVYPIKYRPLEGIPLLETLMEQDREWGTAPHDMIPFAADQSEGRYYCHAGTGQVFCVPGYDVDDPVLVCDSFTEFIGGLEKV